MLQFANIGELISTFYIFIIFLNLHIKYNCISKRDGSWLKRAISLLGNVDCVTSCDVRAVTRHRSPSARGHSRSTLLLRRVSCVGSGVTPWPRGSCTRRSFGAEETSGFCERRFPSYHRNRASRPSARVRLPASSAAHSPASLASQRCVFAHVAAKLAALLARPGVRRRALWGMLSVLSYGRLVARAVFGGFSQTDGRDYSLVTASCGFGKDFCKGILKKGMCYGDDACFIARHRSADVLGERLFCLT